MNVIFIGYVFFSLCKMCFARKILLLSSELDEGKNGIVQNEVNDL